MQSHAGDTVAWLESLNMRSSKAKIPPPPVCTDVDLSNWADCLILGIGRARTVQRLNIIYRGWEAEINEHSRRGEIIEAMAKRKEELA
jgi:hypothetical protein